MFVRLFVVKFVISLFYFLLIIIVIVFIGWWFRFDFTVTHISTSTYNTAQQSTIGVSQFGIIANQTSQTYKWFIITKGKCFRFVCATEKSKAQFWFRAHKIWATATIFIAKKTAQSRGALHSLFLFLSIFIYLFNIIRKINICTY